MSSLHAAGSLAPAEQGALMHDAVETAPNGQPQQSQIATTPADNPPPLRMPNELPCHPPCHLQLAPALCGPLCGEPDGMNCPL